jgi:hypothetical protein
MSDTFLRLIPVQPEFQPSHEAAETAVLALRKHLPADAAVEARRFPEIQFVDQGSNFERVLCPRCNAEITSHWLDWMDEAHKSKFAQRTIKLPCCLEEADLNDLIYEWPAGLASFKLEALFFLESAWLPQSAQSEIEAILGCRIRQILGHY